MCDNGRVTGGRDRRVFGWSAKSQFLGLHLPLSLSRRAQITAALFLVGALARIPWTVFLGLTLPPKYDAGHWGLLWTGFDVALICVLLLAAWAARYRRQILAAIAIVAGTLLLCDAWFDMVTSFGHRDEWLTMLTGFGGELPLAVFFFWLYHRIVMNTLTVLHNEKDNGPRPRRLRDFNFVQPPSASPSEEGRRQSDPWTDT